MKCSRKATHRKTHALPKLRFEEQQLTSFAGLVVVQELFSHLELKARLRECFRHLGTGPIFGYANIMLLLIVHMLLGYRELRQLRYYEDDPLVRRVLGLTRLPDVATVCRALASADGESVQRLRRLLGQMVLLRLTALCVSRITLDFDGSVIGTSRHAQGTAVGFNRKKKGQRSYYPLFCTVAQTGQVLDVVHRSGNVHDSNGAREFIVGCIARVRAAMPRVTIEVRMDAAFFSDPILAALEAAGVQYTVSVPFERLAALKSRIEARRRWHRLGEETGYFELHWKAKSWRKRRRLLFIRTEVRRQEKGPLQLELFTPHEYGYDFKAVLTNKRVGARAVLQFHNGRGAQENLFAELKSENQLDYVPVRAWVGNQIYLLSAVFAHNLGRELQMIAHPPARPTLGKRPALWEFLRLDTLRKQFFQRAGRLIRPNGKLTLSMSANPAVRDEMLHYLQALARAA